MIGWGHKDRNQKDPKFYSRNGEKQVMIFFCPEVLQHYLLACAATRIPSVWEEINWVSEHRAGRCHNGGA